MEKTIEEIKTIVQEYCESLYPRRGYQSLLPFGTPKGIIHRKMAGDFRIKIGSIDLHLDDLDNNDWIAAYRLLGLEAANTVAAERERLAPIVRNEKDIPEILAYINGDQLHSEKLVAEATQRQQEAILKYEAELTRSAKLVEALEEIVELVDAYWKFDSDQQPISSWHDKQDLIKKLQAHKKGAQND